MSVKLKVDGYSDLVRDMNTGAIVNNNLSEYQLYMEKMKLRKSQSDSIRSACREINNLKQDMLEIKELIKELKNNGR